MGIPFVAGFYYKKYNKNGNKSMIISVDNLKKENVEYLFFDYNSLIHPCAQTLLSANAEKYLNFVGEKQDLTDIIECDIIENCINYTNVIINNVVGENIGRELQVYIMIDGVAPRSKMVQQRERRYKSSFFKSLENEKSSLWDSNKITPGTKFMENLSIRLKKEFKTVSDSNESGEGEHKMMNIIKNLKCDVKNNIAIYGLDADLIMLSMMNKNSDYIILIRDDSKRESINFIKIKTLKNYIYNDIITNLKEHKKLPLDYIVNNQSIINFINDYVCILFLLGNDFLEHLPEFSIKKGGIYNIMKAYCKAWKGNHLVNLNTTSLKDSLNLTFLKDIFYNLKRIEDNKNNNNKDKDNTVFKDYKLIKDDNNEMIVFDNLNFLKVEINDKMSYYNYYNIKDIDCAVVEYICGIYWVLGYYNGHVHKNWDWYYKFNNSPFPSDIFNFLNTNTSQNFEIIQNRLKDIKQNNSFTPLKQLCMVLPKESLFNKDILDESIINNMTKRSIFSYENYYPNKLVIDYTDKEYLWQSKIFFPEEIDESIFDIYLNTQLFDIVTTKLS